MIQATTRHLTQLLPLGNVDTATVLFKLTPSAVEAGPYSDAATELLALTPSAAEAAQFADTATELFALVSSGVDIAQFVDTSIESLKLTPSATEHYCPQKVEFEGFLQSRWYAERRSRWAASEEGRWIGQFLGVGEGFAC